VSDAVEAAAFAVVVAHGPDGAITKDAAEEIGFASGDDVIVVIKSTEVMLAKN
jgi:molybdopterin-binding protein